MKTEHLKKHLAELSEVINTFSSEKVQLIVLDRVLDHISTDNPAPLAKEPIIRTAHRNGATRILRELLDKGYFDEPRSISELNAHCNAHYEGPFYTNQLSGLLLAMANQGKLKRTVSPETNRYVYAVLRSF